MRGKEREMVRKDIMRGGVSKGTHNGALLRRDMAECEGM